MRKYSVTDYLEKQKQYFEFLITDFNFKLTVEEETDFDFITEYQKKGIRVHLDYDIRDNFFYFTLIKGDHTKFPNDNDNENIKSLLMLIQKYEPNFDGQKIQPDDEQYSDSLKRSATLLRKYGDKVLKGNE